MSPIREIAPQKQYRPAERVCAVDFLALRNETQAFMHTVYFCESVCAFGVCSLCAVYSEPEFVNEFTNSSSQCGINYLGVQFFDELLKYIVIEDRKIYHSWSSAE